MTRRLPVRAHHVALASALVCAALACAIQDRSTTPVQGWYEERGPVIQHDEFPGDCSLCHAGDDWHTIREDFSFDHLAATGYALEGAHAGAECLRCHNDRGPVQLFVLRGCAGCHEDNHRGQLGQDCEACHDKGNWRPNEQIAKHMEYGFPLVGRHAATPCWRCHANAQVGNFVLTPKTCVECHREDLSLALNPDHQAQGWVMGCDECHIPTSWSGAGFNHAWPLTGAHKSAACSACHAGGIYAGTPDQCVDCHLSEYQNVKDPDHVALNFPMDCQQCHNTTTWEGAQFSHAGIVSGCDQCHLSDYQNAKDPDHVALNLPTTCEQCHNTSTWSGATFDHTGIVNGCDQCHLPDYQGTNNPNHAAAGFPTTCEACHNTNGWTPANFNHTFPINSGKHSGLACGDCHLQPTNFQSFSCTHCHEHNQNKMGQEHQGVSGYVWNSSACYSCHPNGKG